MMSEQCGICGVGLSKATVVNGGGHCVGCKNKYLAACFAPESGDK